MADVTDEMIQRGVAVLLRGKLGLAPFAAKLIVEDIVAEVLAGKMVVDLPEPDSLAVKALPKYHLAGVEAYHLQALANVREARRLSSGDGTQ